MIVNKNSQLGLRFKDNDVKIQFFKDHKEIIQGLLNNIQNVIQNVERNEEGEAVFTEEDYLMYSDIPRRREVKEKIGSGIGKTIDLTFMDDEKSKYYLISKSVLEPAKMIKIGENFSTRILKSVNFGLHTYLMGKHEMCRFLCGVGFIKGWYWNELTKVVCEFGFAIDENEYYVHNDKHIPEFSRITQLMTFIELGDIEVVMLESGRNNGKLKNNGKITNESNFKVYIVDSTWNQLIIRTDGFAVRGHFRLQSCGIGHKDRKLTWIGAFEKHGYKRQPRNVIIH